MRTPGYSPFTPPRRAPRPCTSGFSLIELILVITIISILAAVAVPRYANALARYRADAAAQRIVVDLDYARRYAKSSSTSVTVEIKPGSDVLDISEIDDINDPSKKYQTRYDVAPYRANLTTSDFAGDKKVIFDGYGFPDSGGTVTLSVGLESRTIVLDADTGKAVVQ